MADTEDPEETPTPQESDYLIPGIPDDSTSSASKTSPKMSKIQSLVSTILGNGSPSASEVVPPAEDSPRDPSIQSEQQETSILEETSKSQEELKKSQELSLNGKKTSLDQLSKDMSEKPRAARLHRQCQRRFRELIGKREMKNEKLEKQQGDLKHRLNILECSMPAVMVWNIWRMSQGACVPSIKQVLEKSFQGPASGEVYCPSTPSRHFDCRVREVEAERKQAQKRAEEARILWSEKAAALEEKNRKLEEARKAQEQIKENIEKLKVEAQKLREAAAAKMKDDGTCESGECGVIECKKRWLDKVPSSASIKSTDIECLEELQQLAETELCMKRQIADLERREEAYMRTLQQADELWSKLQGDAASTMSTLQEQLDVKTAANQQMADRIVQLEDMLEKLRTKMANCRNELEKYMSIGKIEALIGRDDDFADVVEQKTSADVLRLDEKVGSKDDVATVEEKGVLSKEEVSEKDVLAKPDVADLTTDVQRDDLMQLDDAQLAIKSEDVEEKQKLEEAKDYLASYGSLSELFTDDDYVCAPDFVCNDQVFTETGLTEEEMKALKEGRVTAEMLLKKLEDPDGISTDVTVEDGKVPGAMMRMMIHTEDRKEAAELLHEVGEEEIIAVDEITVESDRKIDDEQETPVATPEETEIDAVQEAFIEAPMSEEEIVERMTAEAEAEDYTLYQDAVGDDNILVPRDELLMWQGNVDAVRETIATCPDCLVVKKDADEVAEMIARHTGITMRDVIDDPRRREEEVEEPRVLEQVSPTEIEVQEEEKRQIEPEIEEAEVITVQPPKQEEVSSVFEEIAQPMIKEEIKDIEEPITAEKVAEVEVPAEKQKIVTPTVSVVQEVSKEPSKVSVPQVVPVKEETPPLAKEEIPPLMKEAVPVAVEISPKEVEKVTVEAVKIDTVPEADKEDVMTPVAVDEVKKTLIVERTEDESPTKVEEVVRVEVVKEVAPSAEERMEVKQAVSPEEKDVDAITIKEKEEPKVVEAEVPAEKKEDEAPVSREEETKSRILPEEDEMVTAQKKEIEDDLLPEVEEKKAPEEEKVQVDMLEVMEEPKEEDIAVELLPEKEEIPVSTKEEVVVELLPKEEEDIESELLPEKEEQEIPIDEEVKLELLPVKEEEEIPTEEEVAQELLPEKEEEEIPKEEVTVELLPDEVPKEEEMEMEMLPEEEEVSEPKEEGEEEAEVPTEEAEETTVLSVAVIPEEEVGIEAEEAPVPEEKVEEVPVEEIIEVEEIVDKEKIEEVPEEEKVEMLPEEVGEEPAEEKEEEVTEVPVSEELEICIEEICEGPCKEEVPAEEKESKEVIEVPVLEELEICIVEICEGPCKEEVPAEEKESEEVIEVPVSEEMEIPVEVCMVEICKEEICRGKVSVPEVPEVPKVPEVPAPEEMVSFPCVCFTEPEVPKDKEEAQLLPCVCFDEPEVPEDKEEAQLLPCVCVSEPEVQKVPDKEVAQTFPCVCFDEPEVSKVPAQEEAPCDCLPIPEEPAPKASKPPVPEDPTKLCSCFFTLETPEAPAPKIPTPEVPLVIPFVSVLPTIAEQQTEPETKIEITQTEFSATMESVEVVTQTVSETGTQTPTSKYMRRSQQPKIITITKSVDPELEILDQLTRRLAPITEPSLTITTAASTQTEKSSFLQVKATCVDSRPPSIRISEILQSLKAEVAYLNGAPKSDQERELKSFHYGKKPKQPELAKCNCCMCGKDVPSSMSIDPRTQRQSSTVCCAQSPPPTTRKTVTPYTNQGVQYETICPECKIRKLQEALKSQESLRSSKKEAKKPTSDKEVCAVPSVTPRGIPFHRLKKKVDQCCSAKISKASTKDSSKDSSKATSKASSKLEKPSSMDKVDPEKEVQEIMSATKASDKESLMHCVCSCEIENGESGEFSIMHCACGDPD